MTHRAEDQLAARLRSVADRLREGEPMLARSQAETLCAQHPQEADSWILLAAAHNALDDRDAARTALLRALAIAPDHPAANNNIGNLALAQGNPRAARDYFATALQRDPSHLGARLNLAATYLQLDDHAAALHVLELALAQAPQLADAHFLQGLCLEAAGRHREAIDAYAQAERLAPTDARYPYQRGLALEECKRHEEAKDAFAVALVSDPHSIPALAQLVFMHRRLCDWKDLPALSARLLSAVRSGLPGATAFSFLSEPATAFDQLQCARSQARMVMASIGLGPMSQRRPLARHALPASIRVGFLSNGFGAHPTGLLTVALFEELRSQAGIETHLFALNPDDGGPMRQRLQSAAIHWHDVAAQPADVIAQRIAATGIEVLFDLRGWGGGGMPQVLALRPAPLQVNWLAYPGTSGAPWIDYILADRFVVPERLVPHFSEAIAWLPRCFQPNDTRRHVPPPPSRADCGLPDSGVVFCCFNNSYKISPETFERAMAVLRGVPDSVLWLLAGPGHADERLRTKACAAGIDPARLVFMAKQPHAEYLARLQHADLFLDTNPYNAHTTASDALWAGCPLLTCPGETFAARVAGSLNHHLGLSTMNVSSDTDFVRRAIELGSDPHLLRAMRVEVGQRKQDSSLFDMAGFAADFSAMIWSMVQRHRRGLPPATIG